MIEVPHLEWHITHTCNLTCQGCLHYTNDGYNEDIPIDTLKKWYSLWNKRIKPREIAILGGEPLLNKDIIEIIYLTKQMWDIGEDQYFELVTNGLLLHRYPDLPKVLKDTNCSLYVSLHSHEELYLEKMQKSLSLVNEWVENYNIHAFVDDDTYEWAKGYLNQGKYMEPFEDNNPEESWNNCPSGKECFQLFDGNIYKCAPLAYLPLQKKKYKDELSKKWDPYLKYIPLYSSCSNEEIVEFFNRKAESVCAMCPKKLEKHIKRNPLYSINYLHKNFPNEPNKNPSFTSTHFPRM